jgi:hypothetical protein
MVQRFEFPIPNDPRAMRQVDDRAVAALDAALGAAMPGAGVMHGIDPRRILTFAAGGPPVWSVAVVSQGEWHQFLTYGLSRAVDRTSPFGFELSLRVRDASPSPMWPMLLLRMIARYHLASGREITPGQFIDAGAPISQAPVAPHERAAMPSTRMTTVMVLPGASIPSPAGPIEVRNLFGLDPDERDLLESCRSARFIETLAQAVPGYVVALDAPSLAANPAFRSAIEAHAAKEGSDCKALCIPGLAWSRSEVGYTVNVPAHGTGRLRRRLASRLPFGEGLLVHAEGGGPGTEILFVPGSGPSVSADGRMTIVLPPDAPILAFLKDGEPVTWSFRSS